jgi:hypothetical protein
LPELIEDFGMKAFTKAIRFLETLAIPEGPKAGELIRLAMKQGNTSAAHSAFTHKDSGNPR